MNPFAAINAASSKVSESVTEGEGLLPGAAADEETAEGEAFSSLLQQEQNPPTEEPKAELLVAATPTPPHPLPELPVEEAPLAPPDLTDLPTEPIPILPEAIVAETEPPTPPAEVSLPDLPSSPRQDLPIDAETPSPIQPRKPATPPEDSETIDKPPVLPRLDVSPPAGMPVAKQDQPMPARTPTTKNVPPPTTVDVKTEPATNESGNQDSVNELTASTVNEGEFFSGGSDEFRHSFSDEVEEAKGTSPISRLRVAARETILFHALQLKDLGRTHLDVTFQPDNDTVITLHLQSINGEIVVEGRLDQGGNPELFADWNRLQRSLSRDGVQLRNLDVNQHERRDAQHHREERRPEQQPAFTHGEQFTSPHLAAADAAPFPGVVALHDRASTWQAWG